MGNYLVKQNAGNTNLNQFFNLTQYLKIFHILKLPFSLHLSPWG